MCALLQSAFSPLLAPQIIILKLAIESRDPDELQAAIEQAEASPWDPPELEDARSVLGRDQNDKQ